MPIKKKKTQVQEINASSMADIAFLLLIFFLVTTTIASEKGLPILLPPKRQENELTKVEMNDRDVFKVLINSRNQLLVEDEPLSLDKLREAAKKFIDNRGRDKDLSESPQKAAVSYKSDRGTKYSIYIRVLDEIKAAYHELRAEKLGITLDDYVKFDEKSAMEDKKLINKVKIFSTAMGEPFSQKMIKKYLNLDAEKAGKEGKKKEVQAYQQARNSGPALFIEKYYDANREYPLRISEAEPTKIGG
jgi:biopolymer transport protein ExbD